MKTALLVIDTINGIIGGSCKDYAANHPIIERTNEMIAHFRKNNDPIYFIRLAFDENYKGAPKHSKMFNYVRENGLFQLSDSSTDFVSELDIQESDSIINKKAASPFYGNNLHELLVKQNIEKLIFTGVATDNAINTGVREANDHGFYTVIVKDTCGSSSEEFHEWSLTMLEKIANEIVTTQGYILNKLRD